MTTRTKIAVGAEGTVECKVWFKDFTNVHFNNDVGGTADAPLGMIRVRITKHFHDYETGHRCVGVLLDAADIERFRVAGTTGYRDAANPVLYVPRTVYFDALDFVPDRRAK